MPSEAEVKALLFTNISFKKSIPDNNEPTKTHLKFPLNTDYSLAEIQLNISLSLEFLCCIIHHLLNFI